eukprot:1161899-Pelagomonas_calceolata.AAC.2
MEHYMGILGMNAYELHAAVQFWSFYLIQQTLKLQAQSTSEQTSDCNKHDFVISYFQSKKILKSSRLISSRPGALLITP